MISMMTRQGHRQRGGGGRGGARPPPFPGAKMFFPQKMGIKNFNM